jgi:orf140b gp
MLIDTEKVKEILMNKEITGYSLWKNTGVSQQAISRLRSGKKRFEDLSLETIIKIQSWIDEK